MRTTRLTRRMRDSFLEFVRLESTSGVLLIVSIVVAMILANGPSAGTFLGFWQTKLTFQFGEFGISKPLLLWINDGLMAIFFLGVGLEIKREMLVGDLSSPQRAALPIAAALGGMVVPAAIYAAFNAGSPSMRGWGIPMATDIAFSLGVLSLLGSRAPTNLKLFLTALAIVDDIGAVLVIALFYSGQIQMAYLGWAAAVFAVMLVLNRLGVRRLLPYGVLGVALWVFMLKSGVHATLAGVLMALATPARVRIRPHAFRTRIGQELDTLDQTPDSDSEILLSERSQEVVRSIEHACEQVQMPVDRMQHLLHGWTTFAIVPLFALANSGIPLTGALFGQVGSQVSLGVLLGLVVGKPLGILVFAFAAVRAGWAELPHRARWSQILGVGCVAGIGYTMSLFIAELAFVEQEALLAQSKLAIMIASLVAALAGFAVLSMARKRVAIREA